MSNTLRGMAGQNFPTGEWNQFLKDRQTLVDEITSRLNLGTYDTALASALGLDTADVAGLHPQQKRDLADAMHMQQALSQYETLLGGSMQRGQVGTSEYNDLLGIADFYQIRDPEKYDVDTLMNMIQAKRAQWVKENREPPSALDVTQSLFGAFATRTVGGLVDLAQNIPFIGDALARTDAVRNSDRWLNMVSEAFRRGLPQDHQKGVEAAERLGGFVPNIASYALGWGLLGKIGFLAPVANVTKGTMIARTALRGGATAALISGGGDRPISERALDVAIGSIGGAGIGAGGRVAGAAAGAFAGGMIGGLAGGDTESTLGGAAVGALLFGAAPALIGKAMRSFPLKGELLEEPAGGLPGANEPIQNAQWEVIRGLLPPGRDVGLGAGPTEPAPLQPVGEPILPAEGTVRGGRAATRLPASMAGYPETEPFPNIPFEMGLGEGVSESALYAESKQLTRLADEALARKDWDTYNTLNARRIEIEQRPPGWTETPTEWEIQPSGPQWTEEEVAAVPATVPNDTWYVHPSKAPEVFYNLAQAGLNFVPELENGVYKVRFFNPGDAERAVAQYSRPEDLASGAIVAPMAIVKGKADLNAPRGEFKIKMDIDESIKTKWRQNYSENMAIIATREGIQNAIDAVRVKGGLKPDAEISVNIDSRRGSWTITDNGTGMSPQTVGKQWVDLYGSLKPEQASGGFGIGMTGPVAASKEFHLITVWQNPKTKKFYRTEVVGSGEAVRAGTQGVQFAEVPPQKTGTYVMIQFPEEENLGYYDAKRWLKNYLRNSIVKPAISVQYDGRPFDITKDEYGRALPPLELPDAPAQVISIPGADIEVWPSTQVKELSEIPYHVLNNGMFQFGSTKWFGGKPLEAPAEVVFNIKPTVDTENPDYPFTQARNVIKDPVTSAINAYLGAYQFGGGLKEAKKLEYVFRNPVPLGGDLGVYSTDPGISNVMLGEVLNKYPHIDLQPLAQAFRTYGRMVWAVQRQLPFGLYQMEEPKFAGLATTGKALGVNIQLKGLEKIYDRIKQNAEYAGVDTSELLKPDDLINSPNLIMINPWATVWEGLFHFKKLHGVEAYEDPTGMRGIFGFLGGMPEVTLTPEMIPVLANDMARSNWGTLVHEPIHQIWRDHAAEFAGSQTRNESYMGELQGPVIQHLTELYTDLLNSGFYDQVRELSALWTEENMAKEITGAQSSDINGTLARRAAIGVDVGDGFEAGYGDRVAPTAGPAGISGGAANAGNLQPTQDVSSYAGSPVANVGRSDQPTVQAGRDAAQLTKREAVLASPALDQLAAHGKFTDADVAQAQLASYPGQASVIRNVEDTDKLFADAKDRGIDTSHWRVVERTTLLPGGTIRFKGETTGILSPEAKSVGEALSGLTQTNWGSEHGGFFEEYLFNGEPVPRNAPPPTQVTKDVIVTPSRLSKEQIEQYNEFGIFSGMRVITPGGTEAVAGKNAHEITYEDGTYSDMIPWEVLLPAPSTQFVHDSPQAYGAFKSFAEDYMAVESARAGIDQPNWLSVETSSQLPHLMKSWFDSVGIDGKDEQALLELYFDRARLADYRAEMPDKDLLDKMNEEVASEVQRASTDGTWNPETVEDLAEARGWIYDPESRELINMNNEERVPVEYEQQAIEFLKNYTAEAPDMTPVTDVPFEVIPQVPGDANLADGQMPQWQGAEEFFDSVERTAAVIGDMFGPDFLHGAKSGGGGAPPEPPRGGPPPIQPPEGPRGELPGQAQTLEQQFKALEKHDPMRYKQAIDKMDSILIQWVHGLRAATIRIETHLKDLGITEGTLWRDLENVEVGLTKAHNAEQPYFDEFRDIVKDFSRRHRRDGTVVHIEEIPNWNDKLAAMQRAGYTPEEMAAQSKIRPFFDKMHGEASQLLGQKINYIFDYIPLLRKFQSTQRDPWGEFDKRLPRDLSWFALHARHYGIQARQLDIATLGTIYIRGLMHEAYIKAPWTEATAKWDLPGIPDSYRGPVVAWLDFVRTGLMPGTDPMVQGLRYFLNKMGLPVTDGDMAMFWGISFANSYRGMIGGSPYHIFRDSIQPWMTGCVIGHGYVLRAYGEWIFGGPEARQRMWDLALQHGWVEKGMVRIPNADAFSTTVTNEAGADLLPDYMKRRRETLARGYDWIYDHLPARYRFGVVGSWLDPMTGYTHLGEFNRIIAGYAGWLRAQEGINAHQGTQIRLSDGTVATQGGTSVDQLLRDVGADLYPKPILDQARDLADSAPEDLAGLMAREAATTQMRYGAKEYPFAMRRPGMGMFGRIAMMLGSFTNQFVSILADGLNPKNGGWKHSLAFASRYGLVQGAVALAASYTGWRGLKKLLWHKSLTFSGGPLLNSEVDWLRAAVATGKIFTDEPLSPQEQAAVAQLGIQNPFVAPWARGVKTVEGTLDSMGSVNPVESTLRFWATGEAGTFRDFRNFFDEGWKERYLNQQQEGLDPDTQQTLRERARSISQGAGFSQ